MFQQHGKKLCYMLQQKDDSELFSQVKLGVEEHYSICCCWFHVHVCSFIGIIIIIILSPWHTLIKNSVRQVQLQNFDTSIFVNL